MSRSLERENRKEGDIIRTTLLVVMAWVLGSRNSYDDIQMVEHHWRTKDYAAGQRTLNRIAMRIKSPKRI
jgi:hypothetical protein